MPQSWTTELGRHTYRVALADYKRARELPGLSIQVEGDARLEARAQGERLLEQLSA